MFIFLSNLMKYSQYITNCDENTSFGSRRAKIGAHPPISAYSELQESIFSLKNDSAALLAIIVIS